MLYLVKRWRWDAASYSSCLIHSTASRRLPPPPGARMRRRMHAFFSTMLVAVGIVALSAQTPIPTQGGRGQGGGQGAGRQGGQGRGGGAPQPSNLPATPVAAPLAAISAEVTGPGNMFESLMELKPG